ncbi:MAG: ornithine cyclodeaminase/alanine dehydrogenase-like protein (mu-crystallin family) [Desulforhopalus sp.]|jgi:ornithine cyclodeaminase/alanine dehydrogenase-like protein (mu-crystallin family)
MTQIRILSGKQIRAAVSMKDIVEAMELAFVELSTGSPEMPIRSHISIAEPQGTALFMPSYMKPSQMIGIKTVTLFEDNRSKGLPYIQGMVNLFDGNTGTPRAVLDGMTITALRTGAASGLATSLLSRKESKVCAIFGGGVQGRTQLEAVCAVRDITKVFIYDALPAAAESFAKEMREELGVEIIVAKSSKEAVQKADIICCASIAETPIFDDQDLPAGVHINAVGSYKPHVQEVPEAMVLRSRLYVDHRESALEETGDLIIPINKGLFTEEHIVAEIGEVAAGKAPGRSSDSEITFFKTVGVAVQDLAAATIILQRAEEQSIGNLVEL